jgi:prepilin-type N-terminal cleavage/methylation domain-containing protein
MKLCRNTSCGMTLIEVLVAISIASLLAVAGFRALSSLTSSASLLTETAQRWQTLDATLQNFERTYRQALPGGGFAMTPAAANLRTLALQKNEFGGSDETIAAWRFAAWDGNAWVETWQQADVPRAVKVTITTVRGDTVERRYAR